MGLVLAAQGACDWQRTAFLEAARANMRQISNCQVDGLLAGGPHYADAGQSPCIHHSFDHAKALAILAGMGMLGELGDGETLRVPQQYMRWGSLRPSCIPIWGLPS